MTTNGLRGQPSKTRSEYEEENWTAALALAAMDAIAGETDAAQARLQQVAVAGNALAPFVSLHAARLSLALANDDIVIEILQEAASTEESTALSEILFYTALAYARRGNHDLANAMLTKLLERARLSDVTPALSDYAQWLLGQQVSHKRALLIGVGEFSSGRIPPLFAPTHDVALVGTVLSERFVFSENDILPLVNQQATRTRVIEALQRLANDSLPSDVVVIYFTGHATYRPKSDQEDAVEETFVLYDSEISGDVVEGGITGAELHALIGEIPTRNVTVILDSGGTQLLELLRTGPLTYKLLLAASPGQRVREGLFGWEGGLPSQNGVFTRALVRTLRAVEPATTTAGEVIDAVKRGIEYPVGGYSIKAILKATEVVPAEQHGAA